MVGEEVRKRESRSDGIFKVLTAVIAANAVVFTVLYFFLLTQGSIIVFQNNGLYFLYGTRWAGDIGSQFGLLPYIYGSLVTSAIALAIGVPISLGVAVFLSELSPSFLRSPISFLVEMLAAVPSVVYGLWGLFILAPFLRDNVYPFLQTYLAFNIPYLGYIPFFRGRALGTSFFTAGVILAIMIIPIISSISRDALLAVPDSQREAAYALGATKSEAIRMSVLSYARSGIFASIFLGLGRAFGETIAVTMVIGNSPLITPDLLSSGNTLASLIANEFFDATNPVHVSALVGAGLVLLAIVFITNLCARFLIRGLVKSREAASYL
jgi:phosphate transport system permease protein